MVLEKTPNSPLDSKEIKPVNLKGNQSGILIGRTDVKLKLQDFGHLMKTADCIRKVPDAGKDGGQKEKRVSEDKTAGWHHRCNGSELGKTSGDGEGDGGPGMLQSVVSQRVGHDWVTPPPQEQVLNYMLLYKNDHVNRLSRILTEWQITGFCILFAVVFTGSRKLTWHRAGTQHIFF